MTNEPITWHPGQTIPLPADFHRGAEIIVGQIYDAQAAFNAASHLMRMTQEQLFAYIHSVIPETTDWEFNFNHETKTITLLRCK